MAKEFENRVDIPKEVLFYLVRLADLSDLLVSIDRGEYPLETYQHVPIMPDNYSKGLRWAVLRAKWGTVNMLSQMGYGKEASLYLKFDKKIQAQSQQEGKM